VLKLLGHGTKASCMGLVSRQCLMEQHTCKNIGMTRSMVDQQFIGPMDRFQMNFTKMAILLQDP